VFLATWVRMLVAFAPRGDGDDDEPAPPPLDDRVLVPV
jgi:hypothetical protein